MTKKKQRILIERAQSGDRLAFEELASAHRSRVVGVIRSRWEVGEGDLEDIVQESLLRAFQALDRFDWQGEDSFFRWLSGIATNVAREYRKAQKPAGMRHFEGDAADSTLSQSHAMRRQERFQRLEKALEALPPEYREVIQLVRLDGMSVKDVARKLNKTPNAVSRMIYRASRQLRQTFGDTESLHLPARPLRQEGGHDDG